MSQFPELKAVITGQVKHPNFDNYPLVWSTHTKKHIPTIVRTARQYYLRSLSNN